MNRLRVRFVHDWLNGMRGGEKCLEAMLERYPGAPIYTLFYERGKIAPAMAQHPIHTTFVQRIPGVYRHYRHYLPLFPSAIESIRLEPCDVVLSMSHCVAKGVRKPAGSVHVCYLFTPVRYAWCQFDEYFSGRDPVTRTALRAMLEPLKRWDRAGSARVDRFVAISRHVAGRVREFYDRDAEVVYPPVDTEFYSPDAAVERENFYLIVSALVPYKRLGVAVKAFSESGKTLVVIGEGPERPRLEKMAGSSVRFMGWRSDEELRDFYRRAKALIFPGEEDFGIVPVEMQACGGAVVGLGRGGLLETVRDGHTGVLFQEPSVEALLAALERFESARWDAARSRENALRFARARFVSELTAVIEDAALKRRAA